MKTGVPVHRANAVEVRREFVFGGPLILLPFSGLPSRHSHLAAYSLATTKIHRGKAYRALMNAIQRAVATR